MSQLIVELGNPDPVLPKGETRDHPCVTLVSIPCHPENFLYGPEGTEGDHHCYQQKVDPTVTGAQIKAHLADRLMSANPQVSQLPGHEPVLVVVSPFGAWRAHSNADAPSWVAVSYSLSATSDLADLPQLPAQAAEVERLISEFYGCARGRPADVEDTHYTMDPSGNTYAPGDAPTPDVVKPDLQANITQNGRDIQARTAFGGQVGATGLGTAATATTFTTNLTLVTNAWAGYRLYVADTTNHVVVWGNVQSNTNAAGASVVTVDRWYNAATPGGAAATTPAAGFEFILADGGGPSSWFMGLSTSTTALGTPSTNTTLPSEITTAGGGLIRQICPWAHTASAATTTLTPVYTANGSDSLPVTVGSVGTCNSMVTTATPNMFFNTLFATTATLSAIGDQLTVTQTITGT